MAELAEIGFSRGEVSAVLCDHLGDHLTKGFYCTVNKAKHVISM